MNNVIISFFARGGSRGAGCVIIIYRGFWRLVSTSMPWEFGDFVNADACVVWCQSKEAMMAWWSAIKQQENSTGVENSTLAAIATMAWSGRKCANICPSVIQKSQSCALGLNFGRCVYSWLYIDFVMYTQGSSVTWVVVVVDDGFRRYIFEWKCCALLPMACCVY